MNSATIVKSSDSASLSAAAKPIAISNLQDIVAGYSYELPRTEWLSKLHLDEPRQNLKCLPLSFRAVKRAFDIVGALGLLVVCSPIILIAAILVKITSPGPVIYRQTRVGLNLRKKQSEDRRQNLIGDVSGEDRRQPGRDRRELNNFGRPFTIYKFRTMRTDAEKNGARFAIQGDARITLVGKFLRRTRIDELPQLWNVIRGDMSLVGPRPERPEFMKELSTHIPSYLDRLGLKPGLTGLAQVVNGYDNELEGFRKKVAYDLLYLQNCCLLNDLKIVLRTIRVVITGEGAI
jgi:lipopolysaccharide/colanic/teichoic acid biosynthesis glycosyltransferase